MLQITPKLDAMLDANNITKIPEHFHDSAFHETEEHFDECVKEAAAMGVATGWTCKTAILGDSSVGKTSILNRLCNDSFDSEYLVTIGVDFGLKRFYVLRMPVKMHIWDTSGEERFRSIAPNHYRGSDVMIFVFDMSKLETLHNILDWNELAADFAPNAVSFLIGTKKDLVNKDEYENIVKEAVTIANSINAELWIVSSLTGHNVTKCFERIAAVVFDKHMKEAANDMGNIEFNTSDKITMSMEDLNAFEKQNSLFANCCTIS